METFIECHEPLEEEKDWHKTCVYLFFSSFFFLLLLWDFRGICFLFSFMFNLFCLFDCLLVLFFFCFCFCFVFFCLLFFCCCFLGGGGGRGSETSKSFLIIIRGVFDLKSVCVCVRACVRACVCVCGFQKQIQSYHAGECVAHGGQQ